MSVAIEHPDPFTVEGLFALPEDGMRHELLDGTLLVSPPPSVPHQLAARRLVQMLATGAPDDVEVLEATGVAVPAGLLVPDVVVAGAEAVHRAHRELSAADVVAVAEVVSPTSRRNDRLGKPLAYAEAGIGVYWRVELDAPSGPEIVVSELEGEAYVEVATLRPGGASAVLRPFRCDLDPARLTGQVRPPG